MTPSLTDRQILATTWAEREAYQEGFVDGDTGKVSRLLSAEYDAGYWDGVFARLDRACPEQAA